jgi:hypothetical protein
MEKVVTFFKIFATIFYFKKFDLRKALFGSNKVLTSLNYIQNLLNLFESNRF